MIVSSQREATRVVIADSHPLSSNGLLAMVTQAPDLEFAGLLTHGKEVIEYMLRLNPLVIVLDPCLPGIDQILAGQHLARHVLTVQIVMLLPAITDILLQTAMAANATSIVLRTTSSETVLHVIRAAARGDRMLPWEVLAHVYGALLSQPNQSPTSTLTNLTKRERQVATLLMQQRSNRSIADELCIAEDTVKKYVKHIRAKLRGTNSHEAAPLPNA